MTKDKIKWKFGRKAYALIKRLYNNDIMASLIKTYPQKIQSGDKLVEIVHLSKVRGTIPPVKPENPADPYVKRSELREELSKLEQRFDDKLNNLRNEMNTKFDEVNAKFDAKFDEVNNKINLINSTLELIVKKLDE